MAGMFHGKKEMCDAAFAGWSRSEDWYEIKRLTDICVL